MKKNLSILILRTLRILHLINYLPDKLYLQLAYRRATGRKLELNPPRTYTQKLQWIKLYDRNPLYTIMVDKYKAKEYASQIIGEDHVVPLLGVWNTPEEIDWNSLPKQFVLKTNHDCGGLVICKDKEKLDKKAAITKIRKSLRRDYWLAGREWPYKNIERKIIAEKYLEDTTGGLVDYKVMCFNGEPKLIQVHLGRFLGNHTQDFYDIEWNKTNVTQGSYGETSDVNVEKPKCFDEMILLSRKLSANIPHVRVDWYIVDGYLYLGELTFFDASGFDVYDSNNDEELFGSWITLPKKTVESEDRDLGIRCAEMFY